MSSKIEWTDLTWNPTIGCSEVSPGCTNCYAARMAWRLSFNGITNHEYKGLTKKLPNGKIVWTGTVRLLEGRLYEPVRRKKPARYFVDSMSDLFHPTVPFEFIAKVYAIMALCPQHTFQVLTKRPQRAVEFYEWLMDEEGPFKQRFDDVAEELVCQEIHEFHQKEVVRVENGKAESYIGNELHAKLKQAGWYWDVTNGDCGDGEYYPEKELLYDGPWPLPNVWVGTSVENQKAADERIKDLVRIPAAIRFLSCEPLLGPLDLSSIPVIFSDINWIIAGGESGPGGRPMHPDWVRGLRDWCHKRGIPFFFKQWGEYLPFEPTAQLPFYRECADGEEFDAHHLNFIDPESGEAGKFGGYSWMEPMDAIALCQETNSADCSFLRLGKHRIAARLDGQAWRQFPSSNSSEDAQID